MGLGFIRVYGLEFRVSGSSGLGFRIFVVLGVSVFRPLGL